MSDRIEKADIVRLVALYINRDGTLNAPCIKTRFKWAVLMHSR